MRTRILIIILVLSVLFGVVGKSYGYSYPPVTPPAAPSDLTATAVSTSQINLSWNDNSSNEYNFRIYRKIGSGGSWSWLAQVDANVEEYSDTGLSAATSYYYRVRAVGEAFSAYSNEANAATWGVYNIDADERHATIQGAIDDTDTSAGDELWVYKGTYTLSSKIDVDKAVEIYGGFDGTETVRADRDWKNNVTTIDGDNSVICLDVTTNATIDGFTITKGTYGIYIDGASPVIRNCVISNSKSQ